jgi:flagellar basal body-associated protein FliL
MEPQHSHTNPEPAHQHMPTSADPAKSSKSLAVALIFAAIFFVAACGIIAWLLFWHKSATSVQNKPTDDVASVTKVSFVAPAAMPASYVMTDQSKSDATTMYYYDDNTNCGITIGVSTVPTDKTVKAAVADALAAAQTQGVTTASNAAGDAYTLKDVDGKHTYKFDSLNLDQDINVQGVNFNKQHTVLLYKQFGSKIASLSYACKSDMWDQKKAELSSLVKAFTVKTER